MQVYDAILHAKVRRNITFSNHSLSPLLCVSTFLSFSLSLSTRFLPAFVFFYLRSPTCSATLVYFPSFRFLGLRRQRRAERRSSLPFIVIPEPLSEPLAHTHTHVKTTRIHVNTSYGISKPCVYLCYDTS